MEAALTKVLAVLASHGPGFVVAAIFIFLYLMERKKSEKSSEKLQELAVASIKADLEHTKTVDAMQKAFETALNALANRRGSR